MKTLHSVCIVAVVLMLTGCASGPSGPIVDTAGEAGPWTHLQFNNNPDNFQFAIVSDRQGGMREGIFESAVGKLNLLQPEFVMSVGDLIDGDIEDVNELNRQWDEFDAIVKQLDMPFFYVVGNHDITNETMVKLWKKRLGRPYYHFVYRDVLFLCLDSEDPSKTKSTNLSDEQIKYFQNVLEKYQSVRWTLVFLHQPMWAEQEDADKTWSKMEQQLEGRSYSVFAGHRHTYLKTVRGGQNYYKLATTGGSSGLGGVSTGQFDHVVWVTMGADGPIIANLLLDGILDDGLREDKE